jgi:hypothetical protein
MSSWTAAPGISPFPFQLFLPPPPFSLQPFHPQAYTSLQAAIFLAAASPSPCASTTPNTAQLSLAISGYNWDVIVAATWYTAVPTAYQSMVSEQEEKMQEAFDAVTGTGLDDSSRGVRVMGGGGIGGGIWRVLWVVMVVDMVFGGGVGIL